MSARRVAIVIEFETTATPEELALLALDAFVQVEEPADIDGNRAEYEVTNVDLRVIEGGLPT